MVSSSESEARQEGRFSSGGRSRAEDTLPSRCGNWGVGWHVNEAAVACVRYEKGIERGGFWGPDVSKPPSWYEILYKDYENKRSCTISQRNCIGQLNSHRSWSLNRDSSCKRLRADVIEADSWVSDMWSTSSLEGGQKPIRSSWLRRYSRMEKEERVTVVPIDRMQC